MRSEHFIDGQWVASKSGAMLEVVDPSNETTFHSVALGNAIEVDLAARAARKAFDEGEWPRLSGRKRATYLHAIADFIEQNREEISAIEVKNNGKPLAEAKWDIGDCIGCFRFYAKLAENLDDFAKDVQIPMDGFTSKVVKEPVGVVGAIVPWNFPLLMASWKVAPALAAGCTVILKPSEVTPISALELGAAAQHAELPPGVLNVVNGLGQIAGDAITKHPMVDKLAFTGSTATGKRVMSAAAADIKTVSLELGGKSPLVIFGDVPIEEAVEWIMNGAFWNKGEVCTSTSRVLIEDSIYEAVLTRLIAETKNIKIGNGFEDGVLLGPLVSHAQREKVLTAIRLAVNEGVKLSYGGKVPKGFDKGFYLEPTIFSDVAVESAIWNEEVFGPVVCLRSFKSEAEAIALANQSRYGLGAAVMSLDLERAERVARAFRAGIVWINCSQPTFVEAPWGGYKQSGIGRELGEWGLESYLEIKQITSYSRLKPWGWYISE